MSFIANAFNALQLAGTNLWLCDCGTELETISVAPRITFLNMKKKKKNPHASHLDIGHPVFVLVYREVGLCYCGGERKSASCVNEIISFAPGSEW